MLDLKRMIAIVALVFVALLIPFITYGNTVSADGPTLKSSRPASTSLFLPEPEDDVLVSFVHGDIKNPYVIGSIWNGKDQPPESDSADKSDN